MENWQYGFVCVVTGASQAVGQAVIHELAGKTRTRPDSFGAEQLLTYPLNQQRTVQHPSMGASVLHDGIACDKAASSDAYKDLVDSVASRHPNTKVIPYPFSVAKEDETLALIDELLNTFGRLDIWVCSSGFLGPPSISDTTPDVLQKCFESQSLAPFFALKYAPPAMAKLCAKQSYPNAAPKAQAYGSIVVIGSVASTYGGCWGPCHTMMAHASLGVVRAGVSVLKGTGVRINCISAGQIETGVDLKGVDMRGMNVQFPPANLQSKEPQSDWKEQATRKRLLEWQAFLLVAFLHTSPARIWWLTAGLQQ
ncbi:hypothetical protein PspLS_05457 [Pyricularia sp. CBS 133598]|nr:hypothetical protein PspLS_05457 [Pyricularia sp. CBS 133598]